MSRSTDVVVLDVDDTLYLERDYVKSGFSAAAEVLPHADLREAFVRACWRLFEHRVRGDTFQRALEEVRIEPSALLVEGLVRAYRSHHPEIDLSFEVSALLKRWASRFDVVLLTGGQPEVQKLKVQRLGLAHLDVVYAGGWGPTFDKPHPRAWETVSSRYSPDFSFVYVGDNPQKDLTAPRALGWTVVRIRLAGSLHEAEPTPRGLREIRRLAELDILLCPGRG